jgi:hypothetical protein
VVISQVDKVAECCVHVYMQVFNVIMSYTHIYAAVDMMNIMFDSLDVRYVLLMINI